MRLTDLLRRLLRGVGVARVLGLHKRMFERRTRRPVSWLRFLFVTEKDWPHEDVPR